MTDVRVPAAPTGAAGSRSHNACAGASANAGRDLSRARDGRQTEVLIDAASVDQQYWNDLWRYRDLLWNLVRRDILVRYRQTVMGVAWATIRPLLTMIFFTVVFGRLAGLPSAHQPYAVMVFAGLLPWQFFSTAVSDVSDSLVANANIVSKVYFPRLILPVSSALVGLVDLAVSFVLLILLMAWFGGTPGWRIAALPLFIVLAILVVFAIGLWLAALNVRFRDVRYSIPFMIQLAMFVSPVGFSAAIIPEQWRTLYFVNPMAGVIEGFRWSLLGSAGSIDPLGFACSLVLTGVLLVGGIRYFRRVERHFADVI